MLALLLGIVLAYELCDKVPSCTLQANGTRPKASIISTMPNGGAGRTFTTTDCIRGLIGITETCQCKNSTMWFTGSPGYCYFSGNYSQSSTTATTHFCTNQNGINTFSHLNSSSYFGCNCYDVTTGMMTMATFVQPVCKAGLAEHVPCSTDGKNDNAALLAKYTTVETAALVSMGIPKRDHFRNCQCGQHNICSASQDRQYCQSEIEYCTEYPSCEVGKVFTPTREGAQGERMSRAGAGSLNLDIFQPNCQCGYFTCGVGEKCETKDIDGVKKYVCTFNGGSSDIIFLIKEASGAMFIAFVFSLIAFVCLIIIIVFWILTCLKVNRAAKLASTNVESQ